MNILLTGGAGFIGSHIADRLLERGDQVTILDDLSTGFRHNLPSAATFHEVDIRSDDAANIIRDGKFDVIAHLAAQMSVAVSTSKPRFDSEVNIGGLLNLMEAARESGTVRKVVFSSTGGAMYDDSVPFPTPEEIVARPLSPYGIAKLASELYLRFYHNTYNIAYTALRFGNVYGPRQNPHGEAGVIAIFARKLIRGEDVMINGDGLQTRDYIYVGDVANAFVRAIDRDIVDSMNIGTARERSVVDIYNHLTNILGSKVPARHREGLPGEVRRSCLQNSRAKELLDWKPDVSFEEGLAQTVEFFKRQEGDPNAR